MYDDGFKDDNSEGEDNKYDHNQEQDHIFDPQFEESEDLNVDSPRLPNDIQNNITIKINKTPDLEDGEIAHISEQSPEIPNESSPVGFNRKASSNMSQGDYEVIGENIIKETNPLKRNEGEEETDQIQSTMCMSYTSDNAKYVKTDKGFSEISQLKKKNLSVTVS